MKSNSIFWILIISLSSLTCCLFEDGWDQTYNVIVKDVEGNRLTADIHLCETSGVAGGVFSDYQSLDNCEFLESTTEHGEWQGTIYVPKDLTDGRRILAIKEGYSEDDREITFGDSEKNLRIVLYKRTTSLNYKIISEHGDSVAILIKDEEMTGRFYALKDSSSWIYFDSLEKSSRYGIRMVVEDNSSVKVESILFKDSISLGSINESIFCPIGEPTYFSSIFNDD